MKTLKKVFKPESIAVVGVSKDPAKIFEAEKAKLKKDFKVLQMLSLKPFEKDHAFFVLEKK